ncbi:MAG: DUF2975 domain-containing protein, partial [Clostridia bacterium]|nr:DUF2975 domain-containing protein [Oscillospiraceae bacterium]MBQ9732692.1 DUF2975 domain-containing protein [Clostridia bacterium]
MNIEKLSTTARRLGIFFKVLQKIVCVCAIVMLCVLAALSIANAVNPNTVIGTGLNSVNIGYLNIVLTPENTPSNAAILRYSWIIGIIGAVCAAAIYVALGYIRKILSPMAEGQPFHPDTAKYIKKLAFISLIIGIAQNIGTFAETASALDAFSLDSLVNIGVIESITVNFTLELGFIIVFFVLLLMSYIFSYGAQLQQLSDETL